MAITWAKEMEIGIETIDNQHKKLCEMVNQLFEACSMGQGKTFIGEMLTFLDSYTKQHFRDEENVMSLLNYPELAHQKSEHQGFIVELDKLKSEFEASGGNLVVILEANAIVGNWLRRHIAIEDKKIGLYREKLNK